MFGQTLIATTAQCSLILLLYVAFQVDFKLPNTASGTCLPEIKTAVPVLALGAQGQKTGWCGGGGWFIFEF